MPTQGTAGTHRYEYSTVPSITLGTQHKLYTAQNNSATAEVITDICDSVMTLPLMNGQGPAFIVSLLNQNSSGKIHIDWRLDMEK